MELDSHADTVVLGRNSVVLTYTGRECDVSPYSDTYKSITGVPIVTGATAWTCQFSGMTYILVFNEVLWMEDVLDHSLINPNQLRQFGIVVQDNPFSADETHIATEDESLFIPLTSQGTTIFMNTRTPTDQELQECPHIEFTSRSPWNPHDVRFPEPTRLVEEGRMANCIGKISVHTTESDDIRADYDIYSTTGIVERLIAEVRVEDVPSDVPTRRTFVSNERHTQVSPEELSDRWCIGLAQAKNTIKITTQKGVRSAILPLSRRYRAECSSVRYFAVLHGHDGCTQQIP